MRILLLIAALSSLSFSALGCEADSVALRYVKAIDDMQWDAMGELLAEDAHYSDPTMIYYGVDAMEIEGKGEIVEFWRSASADSGTSDIDNDVTACFETGGYHMVNLDIEITLSGAFWNINKDQITIPGKQLMIIRVSEEGLVTEHHDYVGYAGGDEVIKALQETYGTLDENR